MFAKNSSAEREKCPQDRGFWFPFPLGSRVIVPTCCLARHSLSWCPVRAFRLSLMQPGTPSVGIASGYCRWALALGP